jgi:ATP-binding cassette subfamily G (WHITE) protein 2
MSSLYGIAANTMETLFEKPTGDGAVKKQLAEHEKAKLNLGRTSSAKEVMETVEKEMELHRVDMDRAVDEGLENLAQDQALGFVGELAADLSFKDLAFVVKDREPPYEDVTILEPTSGHIPAGKLVAIMGPSGCGKSTLLDMIAGVKTAPFTGTVYINGHEMKKHDPHFKRITSYVPQHDACIATMTVRETIEFTARLKMDRPTGADAEEKAKLEQLFQSSVDLALSDMHLEKIANSMVGGPTLRGISGGQKRRVTLARGLCTKPQICFLDEPTSGLSSTDTETVVKVMKYYCRYDELWYLHCFLHYYRTVCRKYNITMCVVIHQPRPEVSSLFDHGIILTNRPGRCIYNGPMGNMTELLDYIAKIPLKMPESQPGVAEEKASGTFQCPEGMNPTDFLLDAITPDVKMFLGEDLDTTVESNPEGFVAYYKKNRAADVASLVEATIADAGSKPKELLIARHEKFDQLKWQAVDDSLYSTSFGTEVYYCLKRKMNIMARDPAQGMGQITMLAVMGVLSSIAYQGLGDDEITDVAAHSAYVFANNVALMTQMGMIPVYLCLANLPVYAEEKDVALHEGEAGLYRPLSFLLSASLAPLPISALAIALGLIIQWMIALNFQSEYITIDMWLVVYLNAIMGFLAMDSLFQLFAYLFPTAEEAQGPALLCFTFFNMMNGFLPSPSTYPAYLSWAIWISPTYYQASISVDTVFIDNGNNNTKFLALDWGFEDRGIEMWILFVVWILVCRAISAYVLGTSKLSR